MMSNQPRMPELVEGLSFFFVGGAGEGQPFDKLRDTDKVSL